MRSRSILRKYSMMCVAAILCAFMMLAASSATNPLPYVNQPLSPESAIPGGAAFTLTVRGTGFANGATVEWNGSALSTAFVSGEVLTATVPATLTASAGTDRVTVTNSAPGGGRSNAVSFQVATTGIVGFSESDFSTAHGPNGLAAADLNGDGKQDLVISTGGKISILLGNGDGTFRNHVDYSDSSNGTGPVLIGDFNGDGKLDVAMVFSNIQVMLGNGDGTLQAATTVSAGFVLQAGVVGDFNGDGKLDLAACGYDSNAATSTLVVFPGNGDGTFQTGVKSPSGGGPTPFALAAGDLNHDGKLDVVVSNWTGYTLLGNGDGTFQAPLTAGNAFLSSLALVELNGDGNLDLIGGLDQSLGQISVQLGNGDGTFQAVVNYPAGDSTNAVVTGDFNSDGKLDVAALNYNSSNISLLLGNGDGTLKPQRVFAPTYVPMPMLAAADFNGDGRLDLVTTGTVKDIAEVMLQNPLTAPPVTLIPNTLTFPTQVLNTTSAPISTLLINKGRSTLQISKVAIATNRASDFSIFTNNCGPMLAAGSQCVLEVTFTPTGTGNRTSLLQITDNGVNSPQNVSLSGVGTAVSLSVKKLTFGMVAVGTSSAAKDITVTNVGTASISFTGTRVNIAGTNLQDFSQTNTCGASLGAGQSCTISVTFKPTATGSRSASVNITDNGGGSPQKVDLFGTGT